MGRKLSSTIWHCSENTHPPNAHRDDKASLEPQCARLTSSLNSMPCCCSTATAPTLKPQHYQKLDLSWI
eukprot:2191241-Amphidinium_carterae.1